MEQTAHNLQQQVELYGEPLGEVVRRITGGLGMTQGGLAQVIGLSAPMLSQLVSAQRVKIGNPAVVSRLRAVSELTDLAVSGGIEPEHIAHELDGIRAATGAYTRPTTAHLARSAAPGQPTGPATGQPTDPPARFLRPTTYPGELPRLRPRAASYGRSRTCSGRSLRPRRSSRPRPPWTRRRSPSYYLPTAPAGQPMR